MRLAIANIFQKKVRSIISLLAVGLGIALLLVLVGMTQGSIAEVADRIQNVGGDIIVQQAGSTNFLALRSGILPERYREKLFAVPGVAAVSPVVTWTTSFRNQLLFPVIIEQNVGRIAMKVFGGARAYNRNTTAGLPGLLVGAEAGRVSAAALLRYGLSLPVHTAICGITDYRQLRENLAICHAFTPMTPDERKGLKKSLEQSHAFLAYPRADYAYA